MPHEHMATTHTCPGCVTLPTSGFSSKPPNDDGMMHWCQKSRKMAVDQESSITPWLLVIGFPPPNLPTITFVDASKLSPELQDILLEYDDDDYSEALNSADEDGSMVRYTAFEKELKAATIGPCSPEKVLSYYVG